MDSRYRFFTLGIPSRDVNAATQLAEASWKHDNFIKGRKLPVSSYIFYLFV